VQRDNGVVGVVLAAQQCLDAETLVGGQELLR
jgi:hypothetical protein